MRTHAKNILLGMQPISARPSGQSPYKRGISRPESESGQARFVPTSSKLNQRLKRVFL